jgi:hypothetical protein
LRKSGPDSQRGIMDIVVVGADDIQVVKLVKSVVVD